MQAVTAIFRFHGELEAFLCRPRRGRDFAYRCARAATLKHAVEALGVPHTEVGRITVDGRPATLARIVRADDRVEVYPHEAPTSSADTQLRFIADAHLGGLARMLRMLGFDTLYENGIHDAEILQVAWRERRVILTRDRELLKCADVLRGAFVHARKPEAQLKEVVARYGLRHHARPFTLCLHCNVGLEAIALDLAREHVPPRIAQRYTVFTQCPACRRIYWEGSHWARMRDMLAPYVEYPAQ